MRTIRTSTATTGSSDLPGLAQGAAIRAEATLPETGQKRTATRYLVTGLTVDQADAARLLALGGHGQIENGCFHGKDDGFGEARRGLQRRRRGLAHSPLRGTRALWSCPGLVDTRSLGRPGS